MILTIENLCKTYGEKVLFSDVNFSLSDGDKIGIVGGQRNGQVHVYQSACRYRAERRRRYHRRQKYENLLSGTG